MNTYTTARPLPPDPQTLPTLCDFCANACGGCSWSKKNVQKPVPGWDAVRRDICLYDACSLPLVESYIVIHCPQFSLEPWRCRQFHRVHWDQVRLRASLLSL